MSVTTNTISTSHTEADTDIFDILANPRRRFLVHALESASGAVDIGTLAEQIAAWELGIDRSEVSSGQRKRLYTAIQQQHLPRMAEAGFVNFDPNRGVVEPTAALDDADIYLETVTGKEFPWSEFYLGLAGVFGALTAAVWTGLWPFRLLPPRVWLSIVVVTLIVAATCHRHQNAMMKLGRGNLPPELEPPHSD